MTTPCPNARDILLSTIIRLPDGTLYRSTRRPACEKWTCPACKSWRMTRLAQHLVAVADAGAPLYVAHVPASRCRTVEEAHRRRGGHGRLVVGMWDMHLHVSDVDLSQMRVVKNKPTWSVATRSVAQVAAALRDPALPVTRGGRWIGGWRPVDDREEGDLVVAMTFRGDFERQSFAHMFDIPPRTFRLSQGELSQAEVDYLNGAWEWWRRNMRGEAPRRPTVPIVAPRY